MAINFIFLGPPGSGKGTQAKKLAQKLGLVYFGTGDLMRREALKGTPTGLEFKKVWECGQGELVSEDLVQRFVGGKLMSMDFSQGVVFDGYPRTIAQAEHLEGILEEKRVDNLRIINLVVSQESLIKRMLNRKVDENRLEDKPEVIKKRIEVYEKQTRPLLEYYENKGILTNIDGEPSIEEVWGELVSKL